MAVETNHIQVSEAFRCSKEVPMHRPDYTYKGRRSVNIGGKSLLDHGIPTMLVMVNLTLKRMQYSVLKRDRCNRSPIAVLASPVRHRLTASRSLTREWLVEIVEPFHVVTPVLLGHKS